MKNLLIIVLFSMGIKSYGQNYDDDIQLFAETVTDPSSPIGKINFHSYSHVGTGDDKSNMLLVKFIFPVMLTENIELLNYGILPIESIYNSELQTSKTFLGNVIYQGLIANRKPIELGNDGQLTLGLGPSAVFATNTIKGLETWDIGFAMATIYHYKYFMAGVNYNPTWGVGGSSINQSVFQYILNYTFKTGTSVNTQPMMIKSDAFVGDTKWLVPVGGGVGQMLPFKSLPMNVSFNVYYNLIRPEIMQKQEWQFNVNVVCVLMGKDA
ncbi:hypothetical protein [Flammeovirga agarivorans]|uniref:Neuromedin U n=1 Tax=Flammeovirga agarivorans TaxID=2726742 RepID=A0A7X8XZ34_9BACT|nr:hypothetical protein [Flammeovirga agarivorans]NLR94698.1 hypothetical protein [Flammeovirga agarivorans]